MAEITILEESCSKSNCCPCLNFQPIASLVTERNYLRERLNELENLMNQAALKIKELEKNNQSLEEENRRLKMENKRLTEEIKRIHQKPFNKERPKDKEIKEKPVRKGAPIGHRGATHKKPEQIDNYVHVYPPRSCPFCNTELKILQEKEEALEKHFQEDLAIIKITTCFIHHHCWCPRCKKIISAKGENELPKAYLGPVAKTLATYLHYEAKVSKGSISKIFREFFELPLVTSSIVGFDKKLFEKGLPLYQQIKEKVRWSPFIHVDETGWNLDGQNQWLWCFTNPQLVFYHIDPKRNSEVVKKTLGEKYQGILISDDHSSYGSKVKAKAKQKCNPHFLRNIKKLEVLDLEEETKKFLEEVKNIIKQANQSHQEYRVGKKNLEELANLKDEIFDELIKVCSVELKNEQAENFRRKILRRGEELFTFLTYPEIESNNNRVERQLRPNVILRKITFGHRSEQGTKNHSLAMSLIETAKLNGTTSRNFLFSLLTKGATESTRRLLFGSLEPRAP